MMEDTTLLRSKAGVVSNDDSAYLTYLNQRRVMVQRQSADNIVMNEINILRAEVQELRDKVEKLEKVITNV